MKKRKRKKKRAAEKKEKKALKGKITGRTTLPETEKDEAEIPEILQNEKILREEAMGPENAEESGGEEETEAKEESSADGRDSLYIYFDDIRKEKILTEKEEKEIIRKAQS